MSPPEHLSTIAPEQWRELYRAAVVAGRGHVIGPDQERLAAPDELVALSGSVTAAFRGCRSAVEADLVRVDGWFSSRASMCGSGATRSRPGTGAVARALTATHRSLAP